jgi:hypothetical protein
MHPNFPQVNPLRAIPRHSGTPHGLAGSLPLPGARSRFARTMPPARGNAVLFALAARALRHFPTLSASFRIFLKIPSAIRSLARRWGVVGAPRFCQSPGSIDDVVHRRNPRHVASGYATGALGDGASGGMYRVIEGRIAHTRHVGLPSDYGRCVANHERVAIIEHIDDG